MKQLPLPLSRRDDLIEKQSDEEILIYDLKINKALCLNKTAATVYRVCDGTTTFEDLKTQSGLTDEIILLALDGLQKEKLLESSENFLESFGGLSRREIIRKVGLASMIMLPIISSLIAPAAANASSGCIQGGQSSNFSQTGTFGPTADGGINAATCRSAVDAQCCSGSAVITNPPNRCLCNPTTPGQPTTCSSNGGYVCN